LRRSTAVKCKISVVWSGIANAAQLGVKIAVRRISSFLTPTIILPT